MNTNANTPVPWWLKAAVFAMFGLCVVMGVVLIGGLIQGRRQNKALVQRLETSGYEKLIGMHQTISNRLTRPTWLLPDATSTDMVPASVQILAGSDASVAIFAATGLVRGVVNGDLLFVGRVLILEDDCVVKGRVETKCWMVQQFGKIEGELAGTRNYHTTNRAAVGMMR